MHKEIKEFIRVGKETLYIIIWTAFITALTTGALSIVAFLSGHRGPWVDRGLGATGGIALVLLASTSLLLVRRARLRSVALKEVVQTGRKGWLDFQVDWMQADEEASETLGRLAAEMVRLGKLFTNATAKLRDLTGRPPSRRLILRIKRMSSRLASRIDRSAARIAQESRAFGSVSRRWIEGRAGLLTIYTSSPTRDEVFLSQQRQKAISFRDSAKGALTSGQIFSQILRGTAPPVQDLDAAYGRLISVLEGVNEIMAFSVKASDELVAEIDTSLGSGAGKGALEADE